MKSMLLRDSVKKASQFQRSLHSDPNQAKILLEERRKLLEEANSSADENDSHSMATIKSHFERLKRDEQLLNGVLKKYDAKQEVLSPEELRDAQNFLEMQEANSLDNSIRGTNELLERAYATREDFDYQNSVLGNVTNRINGAAMSIPFINQILRKTSIRRRRDSIILALLISVLMLLFLFFH
ncbi:SNARE Gos1 [Schizosaccharomyces pombe]|uniref:Protein transport protein gos1 n=1 Tax=Schizosaccharomyces pombe (strain 972 / ATCC 24843) TaxID=284812 RepID=GOS1_SCHPO|nr:putative SNARE protein Gos1 [Schizosaccharomyces pombe]Q09835.1 RecName: Full=Protein transport protein gos1; AltName: Full=Golgi SNAP receptor complex member 1; AltName: Full=Golgi SNARE protein 1 [Schizosaccharomyces pombe 972h-]CAA91211.1 SNARE Gos1 (predicted) [Schizosaccharomyces pombe]|eukprot:NP_593070.1 putative SNARE protein Gos1 [Schizosaccharomyces pombe]